MRITFRKKRRERFQTFDTYDVKIDGRVVGGLRDGGYYVVSQELSIPLRNTWADGIRFHSLDECKRHARVHLLNVLLPPKEDV